MRTWKEIALEAYAMLHAHNEVDDVFLKEHLRSGRAVLREDGTVRGFSVNGLDDGDAWRELFYDCKKRHEECKMARRTLAGVADAVDDANNHVQAELYNLRKTGESSLTHKYQGMVTALTAVRHYIAGDQHALAQLGWKRASGEAAPAAPPPN